MWIARVSSQKTNNEQFDMAMIIVIQISLNICTRVIEFVFPSLARPMVGENFSSLINIAIVNSVDPR